jgi:hypothetical protein
MSLYTIPQEITSYILELSDWSAVARWVCLDWFKLRRNKKVSKTVFLYTDVIKWLLHSEHLKFNSDVYYYALLGGNFELVKEVYYMEVCAKGCPSWGSDLYFLLSYNTDERVHRHTEGSVDDFLTEFATFLVKSGCLLPPEGLRRDICYVTASKGRYKLLKFLENKGFNSEQATVGAAHGGQLNLLKKLEEEGCVVGRDGCLVNAARRGHFETFEWLWGKCERRDPSLIFTEACEGGNLNILKWMWDRCDISPVGIFANSSVSWMRFSYLCYSMSVFNGHFEVVKWLFEKGIPLDQDRKEYGRNQLERSICKGHKEITSWLIEKGGVVDETSLVLAIRNSSSFFFWFYESYKPKLTKEVFNRAVSLRSVSLVKFLLKQGCETKKGGYRIENVPKFDELRSLLAWNGLLKQ